MLKTNHSYKLPIFQRNYKWTKEQCIQLLKDISNLHNFKGQKHYIGNIICHQQNIDSDPSYKTIIDGQQRLVTIFLIFNALKNIRKDKKYDELLFSKNCLPKLILNYDDNIIFNRLLKDEKSNFDRQEKKSQIYINYEFIKKWLNDKKYEDNGLELMDENINKLYLTVMNINDEDEEVSVIYERINSTNLELQPYELIKNFLLMDEKNVDHLYKYYWLPLENKFNDHLSQFINHYLIYKIGEKLTQSDLYFKFKHHFYDKNWKKKEVLQELEDLSKIYQSFIFEKEEYENKKIDKALFMFKKIGHNTYWPLILRILYDYKSLQISELEIIKCINLLSNFVIRVLIAKQNLVKNFNIFFATFYKKVIKNFGELNSTNYYDAFCATLKINDSTFISWPNDEEFKKGLIENKIYQREKRLCKYLLYKIETFNLNEKIDFNSLQIEHIMPQSKTEKWVKEMDSNQEYEKVKEKYLHTLGNLTLTADNQKLSNNSFQEKKQIFSKFSYFKKLNKDILEANKWNEANIKNRANNLSEWALQVFAFIKPSNQLKIENIPTTIFTLNKCQNYNINKKTKKINFKIFEENKKFKLPVSKLHIDIYNYLYKFNQKKMQEMANKNFKFEKTGGKINITTKEYIKNNGLEFKRFENIKESNIYFYSNLTSNDRLICCQKIIKEFGLNNEEVEIEIVQN